MSVSPGAPIVLPYGDAGLLVEFEGDRESRWRAARDLGAVLRKSPPGGVVDVVASFDSVFVSFDPLMVDAATLTDGLRLLGATEGVAESRTFGLPVVYGGAEGPDLALVAHDLGIPPAEVIALHTSETWTVRFVGSPAGAPFMEGPPLPGSVARMATPRTRVPPGSVGLSGMQSIVYNAPSPGGWKLIGRTPVRLFDASTPPHVAYRPGDRIRFVPIDAGDWGPWAGRTLTADPISR